MQSKANINCIPQGNAIIYDGAQSAATTFSKRLQVVQAIPVLSRVTGIFAEQQEALASQAPSNATYNQEVLVPVATSFTKLEVEGALSLSEVQQSCQIYMFTTISCYVHSFLTVVFSFDRQTLIL